MEVLIIHVRNVSIGTGLSEDRKADCNMKYYVLEIDGTWKEIKEKDVADFLSYGCQVRVDK